MRSRGLPHSIRDKMSLKIEEGKQDLVTGMKEEKGAPVIPLGGMMGSRSPHEQSSSKHPPRLIKRSALEKIKGGTIERKYYRRRKGEMQ